LRNDGRRYSPLGPFLNGTQFLDFDELIAGFLGFGCDIDEYIFMTKSIIYLTVFYLNSSAGWLARTAPGQNREI
jgi:hypothetical protein